MLTAMRTYCITALLIACGAMFSQSRSLAKADRYYKARCYALAIPHYKKGLQKDSSQAEFVGKLGDCYRLTNNTQGELSMYGKLVNSGQASPLQHLYYAEALASAGRFNEATPHFEKYTADARGKSRASSPSKINAFNKNADAYRITTAAFNSPNSDFGAVLRKGKLYFLSSRKRSAWVKHRHGWTNQTPLKWYVRHANDTVIHAHNLSGGYKLNEGPMSFANDTLVYLTRNESIAADKKQGESKLKVFSGKFNDGKVSALTLMPFCNDAFTYAHAAVAPDGNTIYFSSDRDGGFGGMDIYCVTRAQGGEWSQPVNAGEKLNTAGNELFPFVSSTNKLYFSSDGHEGLGGLDIYEARLKEGSVSRIYNMGVPVNSKEDDFSFYLYEDNKSGFLSSNRERGGMDDDIYHVEILREVKRGKELLLVVKDKETGNVIPGSRLRFGGDSAVTDERGEYSMMLDEDRTLRVNTQHADYFAAADSIKSSDYEDDKITRVIKAEKDPKLALVATIYDLKTAQPLPGVKVTISELPGPKPQDSYVTDNAASYRKPLKGKKIGDKISYEFKLEKEGYITKKAIFIHDVTKPGDINVNQAIDLSIGKVEVGMDVAKMINLKPIYFDLGKSVIRKDAGAELDKIVEIMKEYPNMSIELGSHTDCRSAAASNMKLSAARAKSSASYIIKKGIDKTRIVGKGYGESKLLNNCSCEGKVKSTCSEDEHALNRRTEFIITRLK
jgi:outer membrane protein OmpA-like peptidoglycan-associated protein